MLNRRVQILLDDNTVDIIRTLAKENGISMGELIRQAVFEKHIQANNLKNTKRIAAAKRIQLRKKRLKLDLPLSKVNELINYGRKY